MSAHGSTENVFIFQVYFEMTSCEQTGPTFSSLLEFLLYVGQASALKLHHSSREGLTAMFFIYNKKKNTFVYMRRFVSIGMV